MAEGHGGYYGGRAGGWGVVVHDEIEEDTRSK